MQRRTFVRTGLSAGVVGLSGLTIPARRGHARTRLQTDDVIRLSSNENPLGISPAARQAIVDGIAEANRYPGLRSALTQALADQHEVRSENVVLGAGSTEVLKMAVQAFATPGGHLVVADPTYEDAGFYAGPLDLEVHKVPLRSDMSHDLDAMQAVAGSADGPVCVYVCNPNNPTGTLTASARVDAWIASAPSHVHFLVDEAYFDFVTDSGYRSAIRWITEKRNVLVVRTFSKVYGMAGIRLGYGLAHSDTVATLRRLNVRNNANHFALVAGLASLGDHDFVHRSLAVNERGKEILYGCLRDLDLDYFPSHTNFVMHRIRASLRTYITRMRDRGFRVGRPFPPMVEHSRLSIGLPAEMERFAEMLRQFRREGLV
jgi:histidinol-phosphate aminotransferase